MIIKKQKTPIAEIDGKHFESEVMRSDRPALVMFGAPWSRPCKLLNSVMGEVKTRCAGSVKVVKINAEDNAALSLLCGVQSIPTLLYVIGGKIRAKLVGVASAETILSELDFILESGAAAPRVAFRSKKMKAASREPRRERMLKF